MKEDELQRIVREVVNASAEPLETTEVHGRVTTISYKAGMIGVTRDLLMYRLFSLSTRGEIHGKRVGAGKGTWVWWGRSVRG